LEKGDEGGFYDDSFNQWTHETLQKKLYYKATLLMPHLHYILKISDRFFQAFF
jgi:hypothetical protein